MVGSTWHTGLPILALDPQYDPKICSVENLRGGKWTGIAAGRLALTPSCLADPLERVYTKYTVEVFTTMNDSWAHFLVYWTWLDRTSPSISPEIVPVTQYSLRCVFSTSAFFPSYCTFHFHITLNQ